MVAETGTLVVVESEGNGRMCLTLPETLISVVGIEKVVPTLAGPGGLPPAAAPLLHRRADEPVHLHVDRARRTATGRATFHLVLLDNGRTDTLADTVGRQALRCIRCSACLNVCPVYERAGGHAYGSPYPGPIGAILTPQLRGTAERVGRLAAVRLVAVRRLLRGVPGRHRHPRGAGASAGAGRRGRRRSPGAGRARVLKPAKGHAAERAAMRAARLGVRPPGRAAQRAAPGGPYPPAASAAAAGPGPRLDARRAICRGAGRVLPRLVAAHPRDDGSRTAAGADVASRERGPGCRRSVVVVGAARTTPSEQPGRGAGAGAPGAGGCAARGGAGAMCRWRATICRVHGPDRRAQNVDLLAENLADYRAVVHRSDADGLPRADRPAAGGARGADACSCRRAWPPEWTAGRRTSTRVEDRASSTPARTRRRGQRASRAARWPSPRPAPSSWTPAPTRAGAGSRWCPTTTSVSSASPDQVVGSVPQALQRLDAGPPADLDLRARPRPATSNSTGWRGCTGRARWR